MYHSLVAEQVKLGDVLFLVLSKLYFFQHGEVQCRPVQCPAVNCKNPVLNPDECCKSCLSKYCELCRKVLLIYE